MNTILKSIALATLIAPGFAAATAGDTFSTLRLAQRDGLGFGFYFPGLKSSSSDHVALQGGLIGFYDHNINTNSQLHLQLSDFSTTQNLYTFGVSSAQIETSRLSVLTTYRQFLSPDRGFYVGAGFGYSENELSFTESSSNPALAYGEPLATYKAKGQGIFVLGELGWQGNQGYYFHIGLQPGAYLWYRENYDSNNISPTKNYRSVANDDWKTTKQPSQLTLGFGWFF